MATTNWPIRIFLPVLIASLFIPGLLGQEYLEEEHASGIKGYTHTNYGETYGLNSNGHDSQTQQQITTDDSIASKQLDNSKLERIIKPNLGAFNPSPQVKFPEPLSSPPSAFPINGETKSLPVSFGENGASNIHAPPYYYYGKHRDSHSSHGNLYYNQIPPVQHHPQASFVQSHDGKQDQYGSFDHFQPEEPPYQHPIAGPQSYYQPDYQTSPQGSQNLLKDKFKGPLKALVKALTTLIPIGLFLAALPPNFVTINSTAVRNGRSAAGEEGRLTGEEEEELVEEEEEEYPVLNLMGRFGISALNDPECESRVFCEISRLGEKPEGNVVQKLFWRVVNDAPDMLTEMIGLKKLFISVRTGSCETYKCSENDGQSR